MQARQIDRAESVSGHRSRFTVFQCIRRTLDALELQVHLQEFYLQNQTYPHQTFPDWQLAHFLQPLQHLET